MEFCEPPRRPFLARGVKHIGLHSVVTLKADRAVTVRGTDEFFKVMVVDEIKAVSRKLKTKWSMSAAPDLLGGSLTPALMEMEMRT